MKYYLKQILPDGYGLAVNPMMKEPNNLDAHGRDMLQQLVDSLPTVLVHPSLASTVGAGNWFEGEDWYEITNSSQVWNLAASKELYEAVIKGVPEAGRTVLIPLPSTDAQGEKGEGEVFPITEREKTLVKGALMSGFMYGHGKKYPEPFIDRVAAGEFTELCNKWKVDEPTPPRPTGEPGKEAFLKYADTLEKSSFTGWSNDEIRGYKTALVSLTEFYKSLLPSTPSAQAEHWQLCPKCNGQGTVSKPPYIAGDVDTWVSTSALHTCDVCNGAKVLALAASTGKAEGWISVEERLPEHGQKVDLWMWNENEKSGHRITWTWERQDSSTTEINGERITHWMPLPKPPINQ